MRSAIALTVLTLAGITWYSIASREHPEGPMVDATLSVGHPALAALQAYAMPASNPSYAPIRDTTVADPVLDASAAMLVELDSGRTLFERNANARVPVASLTKLLSALVVGDVLRPDDIVTVASRSVRVDHEKQTLYTGEQVRVHDLVAMMLVESSNDAAYALADAARARGVDFVSVMNTKARLLGMSDCQFRDPAGLDDSGFCTARDLVRLIRALRSAAPELWPIMTQASLEVRSVNGSILHQVKSTNELLGKIPGIIGGKTGNTDGALGCMILVVQPPGSRGTLVGVILGSRTRFGDTQALMSWAGRAYRWFTPTETVSQHP